MTDETITATEVAATTPVETTPTPDTPVQTPARGPDGKFAAQTPDGATTEAPAETEAPEPEKKDDEPKRNRARERIDQLTAEKNAARREADALRARLEAMQKAPRPEVDPNDYDAIQRESVRGVFREEQFGQTVQQYEQAVAKSQQAAAEAFWTKVDEARSRIPEIDTSMQVFAALPLSNDACEIIAESDFAAEIAHYLVSSPDGRSVATKLNHLSPAQQGRELARIEAKFNLPTRKTSSAPPPLPSVTGSGVPRVKTAQEETAEEYLSRRQKEWRGSPR